MQTGCGNNKWTKSRNWVVGIFCRRMHRIVLILFLHYSRVDITFALWGGDDVLSQLVEVEWHFPEIKRCNKRGAGDMFCHLFPFLLEISRHFGKYVFCLSACPFHDSRRLLNWIFSVVDVPHPSLWIHHAFEAWWMPHASRLFSFLCGVGWWLFCLPLLQLYCDAKDIPYS